MQEDKPTVSNCDGMLRPSVDRDRSPLLQHTLRPARRWSAHAALALAVLGVGAIAPAGASATTPPTVTETFSATGGEQSFAVPTGGVLGVVGESGCGKSTLARLILGLLQPSAGDIAVEGQRVIDMDRKARARLIQPVFQDPFASLNPLAHVRDIVAMPLRAQGNIDRNETAKRVDEMLARVGLSNKTKNYPRQLSGGEQQRVAIARAVANAPRVLFADEPTGNLDPETADHVFGALMQLVKATRVAMLIATHNMELAGRMDRRVSLEDGHVVELE